MPKKKRVEAPSQPEDNLRPSLPRLLAISKESFSFDEQLHEANQLLKLSPVADTSNYSRQELLLKWILEKLRTSAEARANVKAWRICRKIIQASAPCTFINIKDAFLLALKEQFTEAMLIQDLGAIPVSKQKSEGESAESNASTSSSESEQLQRVGKKRKRGVPTSDRTDPSSEIFKELRKLFELMQTRAQYGGPRHRLDKWACFDRVDCCLAFIKHWSIAVVHLIRIESDVEVCAMMMRHFWQMQELHLASAAHLFGVECLPVLTVLHTIATRSHQADIPVMINLVQDLIYQNFLKVARSTIRGTIKDTIASRVFQEDAGELSISELTSGIHSLCKKERQPQPSNSRPVQGSWSIGSLHALLELAIEKLFLTSIVERRREETWINELFLALLPRHFATNEDPLEKAQAVEIVSDMLSSIRTSQLVLGEETLKLVIASFSAISAETFDVTESFPASPIEALAAEILEMNSDIFTSSDSPYIQDLLHAMTESGVMNSNSERRSRYWRDRVAVPLLRGFARVRRLEVFLEHWTDCLTELYWPESSSPPIGTRAEASIWTDKSFCNQLVEVLESSLNAQQIEQLVSSMVTRGLAVNPAGEKAADASRLAATLVVLNAVIAATASDEVIGRLQPLFRQLQADFPIHTFLELFGNTCVPSFMWRLLCSVHQRLWDDAESQLSTVHKTVRAAFKEALKRSNTSNRTSIAGENRALIEFVVLCCDASAKDDKASSDFSKGLRSVWSKICPPPNELSDDSSLQEAANQVHALGDGDAIQLANALLKRQHIWSHITEDMLASLACRLEDNEVRRSPDAARTLKQKLILTWSEHNGVDRPFDRSQLRESAAVDLDLIEYMDQIGVCQVLARFEDATKQRKLKEDVDLMWGIAKRLDSLFLSTSHQVSNENDCFTLFIRECRQLFKKRKARDLGRDWLAQRRAKLDTKISLRFTEWAKGSCYQPCLELLCLESTDAGLAEEPDDQYKARVKAIYANANTTLARLRLLACSPIVFRHASEDIIRDNWSAEELLNTDAGTLAIMLPHAFEHRDPTFVMISALEMWSRVQSPRGEAAIEDIITSYFQGLSQRSLMTNLEGFVTSRRSGETSSIQNSDMCKSGPYVIPRLGLPCVRRQQNQSLVTIPGRGGNDHEPIHLSIALFLRLLWQWQECTVSAELVELMRCVNLILREKRFLVDQFGIETLLVELHRTVSPSCPLVFSSTQPSCPSALYHGLCEILQSVLQLHRRSLGGRAHLLVPLLNQLLACHFSTHGANDARVLRHPPWLVASSAKTSPLGTAHGRRFAKILALLCDPPQSTIIRKRHGEDKQPSLVDQVRKERVYTSHHVQNILHSYVRFQLHGKLGEGVKEALEPGIAAIMQLLDMDSAVKKGNIRSTDSRVRALGACMSKSELALLRREWENWKTLHGAWKG